MSGVHVMAYRQEEYVSEIVDQSGVLGPQPWRRDCQPSMPPSRPSAHHSRDRQNPPERDSCPSDNGSRCTRRIDDRAVASQPRRSSSASTSRSASSASASTRPGARSWRPRWRRGDFTPRRADALAQVAGRRHDARRQCRHPAGRRAGDPGRRRIQLVQTLIDLPLSIDSSIVAALEAGLAVSKGRPLVNSVTGEEERLEAVLPLVKKYDCAGGRDLQRRDRHLRGPGRPLRGGEEDRPARRRTTASSPGHRRRPAGDADRRARATPAVRCSSCCAGCARS